MLLMRCEGAPGTDEEKSEEQFEEDDEEEEEGPEGGGGVVVASPEMRERRAGKMEGCVEAIVVPLELILERMGGRRTGGGVSRRQRGGRKR